jgi:hypothetical protein
MKFCGVNTQRIMCSAQEGWGKGAGRWWWCPSVLVVVVGGWVGVRVCVCVCVWGGDLTSDNS